MENKINIAELLKDCPQGMELDCTMYENVTFDEVITVRCFDDKERVIIILSTHYSDGTKDEINLTEFGTYTDDETAKCVIFPKGKTTWEGFHRPFKDGDIIATESGWQIFVFKNKRYCYFGWDFINNKLFNEGEWSFSRLATEEEKQKFFNAIKENGYRWNAETYELISDKFDINTLKPFESKVLVRSSDDDVWRPAIYGFANSDKYYIVGGIYWNQCIPYEGNEHLLNTTKDCDKYYKNWRE